jgi:small subunit ribosomal protein S6
MRNYELTIIIDGKATVAKKNSVKEKVDKLIKTFKGKIKATEDWGKKDFAYKINKSDTGVYLFFELELETSGAKNLSNKLIMEPDILRHLLIRRG